MIRGHKAAAINCVTSLLLLPLPAAAEALSTAEFAAKRPQWAEMAEKGEQVRVEGRVESSSNGLIRLRKLPLLFRPAEGEFPAAKLKTNQVELTGRIERRGGDLVFVVTDLRERPDDAQTYALKQSALDAGDPNDWYDLADWAQTRGRFYEDRFLLDKASEARRRGLALERQAAANDAAALAALAQKAERFGLAGPKQELLHESLRVRWDALRQDPQSDLGPLIEQIQALLPGAGTPLAAWPTDLAARYAAEPLAVYNRAAEAERATLDRLFYAEVQTAAVGRLASPDGSNGEVVASKLEALLPERSDLAERYREREIEYRLAHIAAATRTEALDLARRLEERGRGDEAKRSLKDWVAAREATLRKEEGPAGLIRAAEDYETVLGDKATAAKLLEEALKGNPKSEVIRGKLAQLGYVLVDGVWITKEEAASRPVDPITLAMREGRVAVGMSPEQVRKTLGVPDRVARAAGVSQVHEAWLYGHAGRGGLAVHFLRYAARGPDEARVVGVATLAR